MPEGLGRTENRKSDRKSKATPPPRPIRRSTRTTTYPGGVNSKSYIASWSHVSVIPMMCGEYVETRERKSGNLRVMLLALRLIIVSLGAELRGSQH